MSALASAHSNNNDAAAAAAPSSKRSSGDVSLTLRPSSTRGHSNHGWLNSYHTFSFAGWYDPRYESLHSLRVINEDRISGGEGFGRHPHREFEIFSYVVRGSLRHADSMGNQESLPRGSLQLTSAGTGISHSEFNDSDKDVCHFLQMWIKPAVSGLKPSYATKLFSDEEKLNQLRLMLSNDARDGSLQIHQDVSVYASLLQPSKSVTFDVAAGREVYVHLIQDTKGLVGEHNKTALSVSSSSGANTLKMAGGDGVLIKHSAAIKGAAPQRVTLTGAGADGSNAEFILFDLAKQ